MSTKISKENAERAAKSIVRHVAAVKTPSYAWMFNALVDEGFAEHPAVQRAAMAMAAAQQTAVTLVLRDMEGLLSIEAEERRGEAAVAMLAKVLGLVDIPQWHVRVTDGAALNVSPGWVMTYDDGTQRSITLPASAAGAVMYAAGHALQARAVAEGPVGIDAPYVSEPMRGAFACRCGRSFDIHHAVYSRTGQGCCSPKCAWIA